MAAPFIVDRCPCKVTVRCDTACARSPPGSRPLTEPALRRWAGHGAAVPLPDRPRRRNGGTRDAGAPSAAMRQLESADDAGEVRMVMDRTLVVFSGDEVVVAATATAGHGPGTMTLALGYERAVTRDGELMLAVVPRYDDVLVSSLAVPIRDVEPGAVLIESVAGDADRDEKPAPGRVYVVASTPERVFVIAADAAGTFTETAQAPGGPVYLDSDGELVYASFRYDTSEDWWSWLLQRRINVYPSLYPPVLYLQDVIELERGGDDVEPVGDAGPAPRLVQGLAELIDALDVGDRRGLEEAVDGYIELDGRIDWDDVNDGTGLTVVVHDRGTTLEYPFTLGELWETLDELEEEVTADLDREFGVDPDDEERSTPGVGG